MSSAKTINSSLRAQGQAKAPLLSSRSSVTPTTDKRSPDDPQESCGLFFAPTSGARSARSNGMKRRGKTEAVAS